MENLGYDFRATLTIDNPGFPGEEVGADPNWMDWAPGHPTGSHIASYYYSDSNQRNADGSWGNMANSSKVFISVKDEWTATVRDDNAIVIQLTTTILQVSRGDIRGNPNISSYDRRDLRISRQAGGRDWYVGNGLDIGRVETLASNIQIGTETIILPPGQNTTRSSLYVLNHVSGVSWDLPGSTDEMHCGVSFRNNLPADYRPGATYIDGEWYSHNRAGGACSGWQGSGWVEQRTDSGGSGTNNPPYYHNGAWFNQYKVGKNG